MWRLLGLFNYRSLRRTILYPNRNFNVIFWAIANWLFNFLWKSRLQWRLAIFSIRICCEVWNWTWKWLPFYWIKWIMLIQCQWCSFSYHRILERDQEQWSCIGKSIVFESCECLHWSWLVSLLVVYRRNYYFKVMRNLIGSCCAGCWVE